MWIANNSSRIFVVALIAGALSVPMPLNAGDSPKTVANGYYVVGRHLYDRCGERVVLRGVNKMIIWTDIDGTPSCGEIAKSGANAVRMVWLTSGSAARRPSPSSPGQAPGC